MFFPVVCLLYFLIPGRVKNLWLLMSSYYFYMQWNAGYALLIFFSTISTYLTAFFIEKGEKPLFRKVALGINLSVNLIILFLFKYYNFFNDSIGELVESMGFSYSIPEFSLLLPVGISFYTFQALGYSIDVYRKDLKHEKSFVDYALFVSFFPQLVAGPIERAKNLLPQFKTHNVFVYKRVRTGLSQMLVGFVKKVVVADSLGQIVSVIFNSPEEFEGFTLLIASVMFTLQIYFDFSGYSDIAIGAAKVLGFTLMQNFNNPYFAISFKDYWSRWHISLSTWFKDYLYIPLGGNRKGKVRNYLNLLITFVVSGVWHGANFTFIIWGLLHGIYQIIERLTKPIRDNFYRITKISPRFFIIPILKWAVVFSMVVISYVFFISPTIETALYVISNMFNGLGEYVSNFELIKTSLLSIDFFDYMAAGVAITAGCILLFERISGSVPFSDRVSRAPFIIRWPFYYICLLTILFFGEFGESPFIYFAF